MFHARMATGQVDVVQHQMRWWCEFAVAVDWSLKSRWRLRQLSDRCRRRPGTGWPDPGKWRGLVDDLIPNQLACIERVDLQRQLFRRILCHFTLSHSHHQLWVFELHEWLEWSSIENASPSTVPWPWTGGVPCMKPSCRIHSSAKFRRTGSIGLGADISQILPLLD